MTNIKLEAMKEEIIKILEEAVLYGYNNGEITTKLLDLYNVIEYYEGDEVLYVGSFTGVVLKDRTVKLKNGTTIGSLDSQPQKFRKII